jgi:SLOG cluster3 family
MKAIFLSASVPDPRRHPRYHTTADIIAIRDSVRALATVVLPHASLSWGGHPAITPLIRVVAESVGITGADRVRLYQSAWFSEVLPSDNAAFERYVLTPRMNTLDASLRVMREQMLTDVAFDAAIFIGGMEGVEEEFQMFRRLHPTAQTFPVASTGAAAGLIYERELPQLRFPQSLKEELAYPTLFRRLLDLPVGDGTAR